jgi:hypothetical protein
VRFCGSELIVIDNAVIGCFAIERVFPWKRLGKFVDIRNILWVLIIQGEESVIRSGAAVTDLRQEHPVVGGEGDAKLALERMQVSLGERRFVGRDTSSPAFSPGKQCAARPERRLTKSKTM